MPLSKFSGYSLPQYVDMSPSKPRSNKLRIGGYDDSGRCSSLKQGKAYENAETHDVVKLRDTENRNG